MSDSEFWQSNPRKLLALICEHKRANTIEEKKEEVLTGSNAINALVGMVKMC